MITIPKSALSESDDAGKPVTPSIGDTIDLSSVQAKIAAESGDSYQITLVTVNGKPVTDGEDSEDATDSCDDDVADDPATGMPMNKDGAALMAKAMASDKRKGF